MKVTVIQSGYFKLDGGAMYGVVPKSMWQKLNAPDDNNMCTWSMRCLLVESGNRKILIDTGMGNKQGDKFRSHFFPHDQVNLQDAVRNHGIAPEEITDVLLTHFHFDHVGGALYIDEKGKSQPIFPNATYWTNQLHFDWAMTPNPRERASFLKENFVPLKEQGILKFIDVQRDDLTFIDGLDLRFVYGHTEAMMVPIIDQGDHKLIYCADLLASSTHIGLPYVMSYDIRPLKTMEEKERLLVEAVENNHRLFFEHDPKVACATVTKNDRGRIILGDIIDM